MRKAVKRRNTPPLKFDQKLVLFQWILGLFEVGTFSELTRLFEDPDLEGLDENNVSRFYHALCLRTIEREVLTADVLLGYDENIVRHWLAITERRNSAGHKLHLKYFQYLSLLFTEIYLDRYFQSSEKLLADLNAYVTAFNADKDNFDQVDLYEPGDLNKMAFWMATGSGKTLLMHVNILQYQHYLEKAGREKELNRIILLTPNAGLSLQHRTEFARSGMQAELFSKEGGRLFAGGSIEIIDIHKLADRMGDKTVAVDAFEGNNLVLVDEGHRGASGEEWLSRRDKLCEGGFSFEYSATFGQAMAASNKNPLLQKYAKCILFDYSYKYFYGDGYGKDYRILNLSNDSQEEHRQLYLTACLLSFYQQQKLYSERTAEFAPFLLERPLWIFVGGTVNAVRTRQGRQVSDVLDILLFVAEFVRKPQDSIRRIERLLSGNAGLLDTAGRNLFLNSFTYLHKQKMAPNDVFQDILKVLFNASHTAALHVENLKGADGELALRLGDNEPFGVISVGDTAKLWKLCSECEELVGTEREFSGSLFGRINESESTINILIGSKKFSEGWSSWRVSTMGLMNIGRSEGSEIIQLFGRGVRLKGYEFSLKRSRFIYSDAVPEQIELLETLQVFGIRADYMDQFKQYLEDEGLPANEGEGREEILLPVISNLGTQKLKTLKIKEGIDFKKDGPKPHLQLLEELYKNPIALDWYPKIQAQVSKGARHYADLAVRHEGKFESQHIAFMDLNAVYFELQRFKNEKSWHNLHLSREVVRELLCTPGWYTLSIPREELEFTSFSQVRVWQEIATVLLKRYCDKFYKYRKSEYELPYLEYRTLMPDDPNFITEYRMMIEESQTAIVEKMKELKEHIESGAMRDWEFSNIQAIFFSGHLYRPLIHLSSDSDKVEISPAALNEGEQEFVLDLRSFYEGNPEFFADKELYLLRNQSRGKGVGFFEAGNFHPDYILWLLVGEKQFVTFIDPKGIRNLMGLDDAKIQFHRTIKQIEERLGDPNVILNSFIVSNTPASNVLWWGKEMTIADFESHHLLFQKENKETYIEKILTTVLKEPLAVS